LREAIDLLGSPTIDQAHAVILAAGVVGKAYSECVLPDARRAVHISVLEALLRRDQSLSLINTLQHLLPRSFGLNIVGLQEATNVILAWRKGRAVP